ncbi:MAG: Do family serine endopeptidase [Planctomycetota bacterium]|jgi:Do/DeqQ family serine protease|nr:Do family serine endopeptidase [Planctomycetota bacterium]
MRHFPSARNSNNSPRVLDIAFPVGQNRLLAPVALFLFLAWLVFPAAGADSENIKIAKALSNAFAEVVERVSPAVVGIETEKNIRRPGGGGEEEEEDGSDLLERFFDQLPRDFGPRLRRRFYPEVPRKSHGIGSGVVIDAAGHILTNNHVVVDADAIKVEFPNEKGKTYKAEIVGRDPNSDLAIIKLIDHPADFPFAKLGDSDNLKPGNIVLAIGSPLGFKQSITQGVVSAKGRTLGEIAYERFIQTDASINPGNSGGPLVNLDGEVVGLNTMISTRGGSGSIGIGFAIPINQAKSVISQLIEKGEVTRGWLGIEMNPEDEEISREIGHDGSGVLVARIAPDGPAGKAGLRRGDLIISFDNIPIKDNEHLRYLVADTSPGRDVPLEVIRNGDKLELVINIAPQPSDLYTRAREGRGPSDGNGRGDGGGEAIGSRLGIQVSNLDDETRSQYDVSEKITSGVVITKVEDGSEAAEKGLRPGTVILEMEQLPVPNLAAFRKILNDNSGKDKILVYIRFGEVSRYLMLKQK